MISSFINNYNIIWSSFHEVQTSLHSVPKSWPRAKYFSIRPTDSVYKYIIWYLEEQLKTTRQMFKKKNCIKISPFTGRPAANLQNAAKELPNRGWINSYINGWINVATNCSKYC